MKKKNSMYFNDYEVENYSLSVEDTELAKMKYIEYLDGLIYDLNQIKLYVPDARVNIDMFFRYQNDLIAIRNKFNAEALAEWHMNYTHDLERKVAELDK